jgi:hypothetical protein
MPDDDVMNTPCPKCNPWSKPAKDDMESAIQRLKMMAVNIMDDFESETPVSIKFVRCQDRFWGLIRTDDDCVPVILWTSWIDGHWVVNEVWLDADITKELCKFCLPNDKGMARDLAESNAETTETL